MALGGGALTTKGANLEATSNVSATPPAAPQAPPRLARRLQTPHLPACRRRSIACVWPAAAPPQQKRTALHLAASNGHAPCVEALLMMGADASLKDGVSLGTEGRGGGR